MPAEAHIHSQGSFSISPCYTSFDIPSILENTKASSLLSESFSPDTASSFSTLSTAISFPKKHTCPLSSSGPMKDHSSSARGTQCSAGQQITTPLTSLSLFHLTEIQESWRCPGSARAECHLPFSTPSHPPTGVNRPPNPPSASMQEKSSMRPSNPIRSSSLPSTVLPKGKSFRTAQVFNQEITLNTDGSKERWSMDIPPKFMRPELVDVVTTLLRDDMKNLDAFSLGAANGKYQTFSTPSPSASSVPCRTDSPQRRKNVCSSDMAVQRAEDRLRSPKLSPGSRDMHTLWPPQEQRARKRESIPFEAMINNLQAQCQSLVPRKASCPKMETDEESQMDSEISPPLEPDEWAFAHELLPDLQSLRVKLESGKPCSPATSFPQGPVPRTPPKTIKAEPLASHPDPTTTINYIPPCTPSLPCLTSSRGDEGRVREFRTRRKSIRFASLPDRKAAELALGLPVPHSLPPPPSPGTSYVELNATRVCVPKSRPSQESVKTNGRPSLGPFGRIDQSVSHSSVSLAAMPAPGPAYIASMDPAPQISPPGRPHVGESKVFRGSRPVSHSPDTHTPVIIRRAAAPVVAPSTGDFDRMYTTGNSLFSSGLQSNDDDCRRHQQVAFGSRSGRDGVVPSGRGRVGTSRSLEMSRTAIEKVGGGPGGQGARGNRNTVQTDGRPLKNGRTDPAKSKVLIPLRGILSRWK